MMRRTKDCTEAIRIGRLEKAYCRSLDGGAERGHAVQNLPILFTETTVMANPQHQGDL